MVQHLTTFMKDRNEARGCIYKIDIKEEIKKYKGKYPEKQPLIVFDLLACLCMVMDNNNWDIMTGGRHTKCAYLANKFCKQFQELGVELVFFTDGPIKNFKIPKYINSSNKKYEDQKVYFERLKNNEDLNVHTFGRKLSAYINTFITTIKKYSKLSISFENECDVDLANYATTHEALAVVTSDSDFLIFAGGWQIWLSNSFKMEDFTIRVWNKHKLRTHLNLQGRQMPIFATLSGNDFVDFKYVEYLHQNDNPSKPKQKLLADFIRREFPSGVPLSNANFQKLANLIYNRGHNNIKLNEAKEFVRCSLNFYNYNQRKIPEVEHWLKAYIQATNSFEVYMILKNLVFTVNQSWIDMSIPEFKPYSELVLPIIRRQMGIILDHQKEKYPERQICFKPSHDEPFQIKTFTPIYMKKQGKIIPPLQDLLQAPIKTPEGFNWQEMDDIVPVEEKFEIFSWMMSPKDHNLSVEVISKFCDNILFMPMICIYYLVMEKQITFDEADVLLISIDEASQMSDIQMLDVKPPGKLYPRGFWISKVYNRLFDICRSSLIISGLYRYVKISYFDGYIFENNFEKYNRLDQTMKNSLMEKILQFRIYVSAK